MTPEQRLDRAERILLLTIQAGRRARKEWNEKVNILINAQIRNEDACRVRSEEIDRRLEAVAVAQKELAESQKLTDAALRDLIDRDRKRRNGKSR